MSRNRRSMKLVLCWGIVLSLLLSSPAPAETTPDLPAGELSSLEPHPEALEELKLLQEETVVTAIRHEQPISQSPSDIYVITDEDIRQSGAIDIPTILRSVPGMSVIQTTAADFNVSVRGDNQLLANKLLPMVDWRSIYEDAQGTVFWKAPPVTLSEIKRIEVLKGPASAIYGFNAFDGIVHIITKSPEEMKGTTVQFGGGEFGTIMASAVHAGTYRKLGYRLSFGHDQTQEWRDRDALGFRSNKFNIHTEYSLPEKSKLKVSGGLVDVNRFDGPLTDTALLATKPTLSYTYLEYVRPDFFIRAFWNGWDIPLSVQPFPLLSDALQGAPPIAIPTGTGGNRSNTYNVLAQHSLEFWKSHRLTSGVNYRYNTFTSDFTESGHENRLGLYVQDEWRATQMLSAVAGLRLDLDTFINPTYSPRVALLFQPVTKPYVSWNVFHCISAADYL